MSRSGKHGGVWSDKLGRMVNSPAFTSRVEKTRAAKAAAKKAKRRNRK